MALYYYNQRLCCNCNFKKTLVYKSSFIVHVETDFIMTWNICFLNRTFANKKVVNRYNICFLADWDAVHLDTLANTNDVYNLQYRETDYYYPQTAKNPHRGIVTVCLVRRNVDNWWTQLQLQIIPCNLNSTQFHDLSLYKKHIAIDLGR